MKVFCKWEKEVISIFFLHFCTKIIISFAQLANAIYMLAGLATEWIILLVCSMYLVYMGNTHPKIYIYVDRSHTNVRMQTHEDRNIFIYIYIGQIIKQ